MHENQEIVRPSNCDQTNVKFQTALTATVIVSFILDHVFTVNLITKSCITPVPLRYAVAYNDAVPRH